MNTRFQPHRRTINLKLSNNVFKMYHQVTFYTFIIHFKNKIKHIKGCEIIKNNFPLLFLKTNIIFEIRYVQKGLCKNEC